MYIDQGAYTLQTGSRCGFGLDIMHHYWANAKPSDGTPQLLASN